MREAVTRPGCLRLAFAPLRSPIILAARSQFAALAFGALRVTDAPAMLNQVDMHRMAPGWRNLPFEFEMCGVGCDFWANQAEAPRHPPDMRIHREGWSSQREQQHTCGRLGSHAGQRQQRSARIRQREVVKL